MLKEHILREQRDFKTVYNRGKSQGSKHVVVLYRKTGKEITRVAFLASKKVGNSVQRNRARRLMREAYRTLEASVVPGYDVILVARSGIDAAKMDEVAASLKKALANASLLRAVRAQKQTKPNNEVR